MREPRNQNDRVVVDASAIFTLVSDNTGLGDAVSSAIGGRRIFVPSLAEYEVANVIRRHQKADRMTRTEAELAFGRFRRIPLHILGFRDLIDRAWQLKENLTILDGVYVALAEHLDCDFLTRDGRFRTAPGIRCPIIVPGT